MRDTWGKKAKSGVVWLKLQLEPEEIAFAESEWSRHAYASRDDYLNALLNKAVLDAMNDAAHPIEALQLPPRDSDPSEEDPLPF